MAKNSQKNLWLPPDLTARLNGVVERINRTAKPKTGPSEIGRIALERLLSEGEERVRQVLNESRAQSMIGLATLDPGETEAVVQQMQPKGTQSRRRKTGG